MNRYSIRRLIFDSPMPYEVFNEKTHEIMSRWGSLEAAYRACSELNNPA